MVYFFIKLPFGLLVHTAEGGEIDKIYIQGGGGYPVIPSLGFTGEHRCQESKPLRTLHFVNLIVSQFIFASQILWRDLFWIRDTPILLVLFHKNRNRSKIFLKNVSMVGAQVKNYFKKAQPFGGNDWRVEYLETSFGML